MKILQGDYREIIKSFRKYWYLVVSAISLSLVAAVFEGFSIGLLIPFLQNLNAEEVFRTGVEWVDQWILDVDGSQLSRLYRICGMILIATWLRSLFGYISSVYGIKSQAMIVADMRMRIMDQLQAVSLRFFSKSRSGELVNSATIETWRTGQSLQILTTVCTQGSLLLVYLTFMVLISWQLTVLVLVFFGLLSLGLTRLITLTRRSGRKVTKANGWMMSLVTEFINGIRTVVAYNMQAFERKRLHNAIFQLAKANIETNKRAQLVTPLSQAVVGTLLIAIILLATQYYVLPGKLDIALLLTFLFALFRLMPLVHRLNGQRGSWASKQAAIENVATLLSSEGKPYISDGSRKVTHFSDALVFDDVSFAYEAGEPILKNINVRIERGETTAIIGASGAGKSTLVDIIPRFHDPSFGKVYLDGIDLKEFSVDSLRGKIAVVSQDTFIFNDTVQANIAYGAPDASFEQIVDAAEKANALEFIEDMQDGFDTMLGDRGVRLSGGQRQRLAIARALLRDPEILILDEATSALDSVSERLVQQSLDRLMQGRTVIAIAHRLSTVENADNVIVLEDGMVVEQGTYGELLEQKGQLWEYHSLQFQLV